jgi:hypothetical protein
MLNATWKPFFVSRTALHVMSVTIRKSRICCGVICLASDGAGPPASPCLAATTAEVENQTVASETFAHIQRACFVAYVYCSYRVFHGSDGWAIKKNDWVVSMMMDPGLVTLATISCDNTNSGT